MIDITAIIISAVVMSILGFITTKIFGLNIPKIISDLILFFIMALPIMFYNPTSNIQEMVNFLQNYIMTFINIIIPALIGDAFGTAISEILNPSRHSNY